MKILQKYKKFYFNKVFIKKCVANAIQASRLFLGVSNKVKSSLLAMALSINNLLLLNLVRKRERRYYTLKAQMLMPDNKLIHNELKNRFDIKE
ncbi:MAG: hypothetical protein QXP35_00500 [Candidatus Micrarchaeaceae archaeon]